MYSVENEKILSFARQHLQLSESNKANMSISISVTYSFVCPPLWTLIFPLIEPWNITNICWARQMFKVRSLIRTKYVENNSRSNINRTILFI